MDAPNASCVYFGMCRRIVSDLEVDLSKISNELGPDGQLVPWIVGDKGIIPTMIEIVDINGDLVSTFGIWAVDSDVIYGRNVINKITYLELQPEAPRQVLVVINDMK